jgi:chromosomal replication initiation ATPase DnaA
MNGPDIAGRMAKLGALPTLERIAGEYGVTPQSILSRRRTASIARARSRFWFVLYSTCGLSYPELGAMLDRDHTTVLSAVHKEERLARERLGL